MKKNEQINLHQQSSVLKDLQILLDFVGSDGKLVSKKQLVFSAKTLLELNQLMSKPIAHNKVRPQQTTFPHIAVVYKSAHQLGFFNYTDKGTRKQINLNPAALESWNKLNPTEQYFTLLDKWLYSDADTSIFPPMQYIERFKRRFLNKTRDYYQNIFATEYKIGELLAGMELFNLVNIQHAKPDKAGGWKINSLKLTKFGDFILSVILDNMEKYMLADSLRDLGIFELFQPYFPDLKNTYQIKTDTPNRTGVFIFKISLHKAWRKIAIHHSATLYDLANVILQAFNFDNDHLHTFSFLDTSGQKRKYQHPACSYADYFSDEIILSELPLSIKGSMKFIFDFGDWWEFNILLEKVDSNYKINNAKAELLDGKGEPPEQYQDWD